MRKAFGKTLTSEELGDGFRDQQKERHEHPELWRGLKFGHVDLDKLTGGIRKSEFIIIAGAQKSGKSIMATSTAVEVAKQIRILNEDEVVLFVSLEMRHSQLAARVLSNLANIETNKFRDYELEDSDWDLLDTGVEILRELPILWNVGCYSMEGILKLCDEYKVRLLIVDYFQLMDAMSKGDRHEQYEELSRMFKRLANGNDMTVMAFSQQSREALLSAKKRKDPNTMAGTQALARDCDMLIIILPYLDDDGEEIPHMRELYVALSRNSEDGFSVDAIFSGKYARIGAPAFETIPDTPPPSDYQPYWER